MRLIGKINEKKKEKYIENQQQQSECQVKMSWKNILQLRRNLNDLSAVDAIKNNAKTLNLIPGPKYYPFIGSLNELITMGRADRLHLTIDNYHRKYGPIFHVKLGPIDSVFISSADEMRSVFAFEGKYPKHPIPPSWIYFNQKFDVQRGLIFMDDEEWLQYRQLLNSFLLRDFRWTQELIETACDKFANKISQKIIDTESLHVPDLEDELYRWSIDVILNLMLGSSYADQSDGVFNEKVERFSKVVRQVFDCSAKLLSIPPTLADKWNIRIWEDFEKVAKESIELSRSLIYILSNEMQSSNNGLLMKMKSQNLSDDIIVRLFSDLIIAAGDTTTYATQWCLYSIAKHSEFQSRIKSYLQQNVNDMESPLIRGCLREVLRLYPVAPFIGRILDSDANIGNFTIPKGWMALLSLYSSGRDPENFSEPLKFIPDRWLRHENETNHKVFKSHGSLPFAIGSRSCVGKRIASYQIHCLITKILQQFSLKSLNRDEVNFKLKLIGVPDKKILIAFS